MSEVRKPLAPSGRAAEVISMRMQRALRLRFQAQMVAEGREHLTPFILDCAIDGLEDRIAKLELKAYRRSAGNTR